MVRRVSYEWCVEVVDEKSGDIIDSEFHDRFQQAVAHVGGLIENKSIPIHEYPRIGLKRDVWDVDRDDDEWSDADLVDRMYLYPNKDGQWPNAFEDGTQVPKRLKEEVEK